MFSILLLDDEPYLLSAPRRTLRAPFVKCWVNEVPVDDVRVDPNGEARMLPLAGGLA